MSFRGRFKEQIVNRMIASIFKCKARWTYSKRSHCICYKL